MTSEPRRALVITAHPDDAEFLCGGTIARWCAEGWDVFYVVATSGDKGSHDPDMTPERLASVRQEEQCRAAEVLGVRECVFLGYPDGFLQDTPEFRGRLVREIRRFKPDLVVAWDPYRPFNHRDHRVAGQAAFDAVYPLSRSHLYYSEHLTEGLEPHRVNEVLFAGSEQPDYYVDISRFINKKIEALLCHQSQVGRAPVKELRKRVRQRAAEVGKQAGYKLAEGFRRLNWG
ncbi:MAG: PIG-L family deacetylase [Chloroflexi bacterium]|nr:PIG-L family deacetylase [Chloroflexota bacterium]